ncbi:MAG: AAA family ATPase, partial [Chloroflexi bacterium]|nr:AAA family ATPase [Chloroflexota bacterium]
ERGVQLIATAHGNTLENLILNPTLSDLVGGVQTVTLGDEEARRRGTQKTILERKAPPTFDIVVEIQDWERVAVHPDVASTVDALLLGYTVTPEVRWIDEKGELHHAKGEPIALGTSPIFREMAAPPMGRSGSRRFGGEWGRGGHSSPPTFSAPVSPPPTARAQPALSTTRVLPVGIGRDKVLQAITRLGAAAQVVETVQDADVVLTSKALYRRKTSTLQEAERENRPIYVLRKNTPAQVEQFLRSITIYPGKEDDPVAEGLTEAEDAVSQVMQGEPSVELAPRSAYVRRLQHQLAERYNLASASTGREPRRRVIIYRS